MTAEDYCELCDLPKSQCVHGMPPEPARPAARASAPRTSRPRGRSTSATASTARRTAGSSPSRPVQRRWTPPDAFKPTILQALREAGGELDAEDLFLELEVRMEERLTPADNETTPEGELRWRFAARRARQALIADGLMTKGAPGRWVLSDRARTG